MISEAENIKFFINNNYYSLSVCSILYINSEFSRHSKEFNSLLRLNPDNNKERVLWRVSSTASNENISRKIYELFKGD